MSGEYYRIISERSCCCSVRKLVFPLELCSAEISEMLVDLLEVLVEYLEEKADSLTPTQLDSFKKVVQKYLEWY